MEYESEMDGEDEEQDANDTDCYREAFQQRRSKKDKPQNEIEEPVVARKSERMSRKKGGRKSLNTKKGSRCLNAGNPGSMQGSNIVEIPDASELLKVEWSVKMPKELYLAGNFPVGGIGLPWGTDVRSCLTQSSLLASSVLDAIGDIHAPPCTPHAPPHRTPHVFPPPPPCMQQPPPRHPPCGSCSLPPSYSAYNMQNAFSPCMQRSQPHCSNCPSQSSLHSCSSCFIHRNPQRCTHPSPPVQPYPAPYSLSPPPCPRMQNQQMRPPTQPFMCNSSFQNASYPPRMMTPPNNEPAPNITYNPRHFYETTLQNGPYTHTVPNGPYNQPQTSPFSQHMSLPSFFPSYTMCPIAANMHQRNQNPRLFPPYATPGGGREVPPMCGAPNARVPWHSPGPSGSQSMHAVPCRNQQRPPISVCGQPMSLLAYQSLPHPFAPEPLYMERRRSRQNCLGTITESLDEYDDTFSDCEWLYKLQEQLSAFMEKKTKNRKKRKKKKINETKDKLESHIKSDSIALSAPSCSPDDTFAEKKSIERLPPPAPEEQKQVVGNSTDEVFGSPKRKEVKQMKSEPVKKSLRKSSKFGVSTPCPSAHNSTVNKIYGRRTVPSRYIRSVSCKRWFEAKKLSPKMKKAIRGEDKSTSTLLAVEDEEKSEEKAKPSQTKESNTELIGKISDYDELKSEQEAIEILNEMIKRVKEKYPNIQICPKMCSYSKHSKTGAKTHKPSLLSDSMQASLRTVVDKRTTITNKPSVDRCTLVKPLLCQRSKENKYSTFGSFRLPPCQARRRQCDLKSRSEPFHELVLQGRYSTRNAIKRETCSNSTRPLGSSKSVQWNIPWEYKNKTDSCSETTVNKFSKSVTDMKREECCYASSHKGSDTASQVSEMLIAPPTSPRLINFVSGITM